MIYLDNAATTKMSNKAFIRMNKVMKENYGNPSSIYEFGLISKGIIEKARMEIATTLKVKPEEIFFTSGGTESNNWAIIGAALSNREKGRHIITSKVEHKSILKTCEFLQAIGYDISYLDVNKNGIVDINQLKKTVRADTILISIMSVNNEIGSVMPLREIGKIAADNKILFHTDAVQAYGHIPMDLTLCNVDLLSVSAHKFHGPKGVGFLYIKNGTNVLSVINGGNQERGMRSGTENVAGIASMAEAAQEIYERIDKDAIKVRQLKELLYRELCTRVKGIHMHGDYENGAPNILSVAVEGVSAVCLVDSLGQKGLCVSAGSACNSHEIAISHVLDAIGVSESEAHSTIRFSLSRYTNRREIIEASEIFADTVKCLREIYA